MLLDILVIGIFILWLNRKGEKRLEIRRYREEIDDFRGWDSDEAGYRIAGNIKRLNRNGITDIRLEKCHLIKVNISDVDLSGSDLSGANLSGANLSDANLTSVDLSGTNLTSASLSGTNLTSASLTRAKLSSAILWSADLTRANLTSALLWRANLSDADLGGSDLSDANLGGAKGWTNKQLAQARSLIGTILPDRTIMTEEAWEEFKKRYGQ
jgi:BTB/POZ domain-containing protein KCTD9